MEANTYKFNVYVLYMPSNLYMLHNVVLPHSNFSCLIFANVVNIIKESM